MLYFRIIGRLTFIILSIELQDERQVLPMDCLIILPINSLGMPNLIFLNGSAGFRYLIFLPCELHRQTDILYENHMGTGKGKRFIL